MSPLNARRIANFKLNRRGYYSAIVFVLVLVVSLFAELIANDKPILFSKGGELYFPIVSMYTETDLGGKFETEAEYTDPFVVDLIESDGWIIWPVLRFSYDTIDYSRTITPSAPDVEHWFGTDSLGSDVFAKILYGFRMSVLFGLALTFFSAVIGVSVGALQGFFGGYADLIGQRIVEIWAGLPVLLILIILASMVESNIFWLLIILSLFNWIFLVGVVRAEFLRGRKFEFVRAARALGLGNFTIMRRHVLPNAMVATLTYIPFILNGAIVSLTALDFLGFGLPLDSPSLGRLLSQAKANLHAPWLALSAFATLALMLTLLIFIGEAVRDAFDPRKTFGSTKNPGGVI